MEKTLIFPVQCPQIVDKTSQQHLSLEMTDEMCLSSKIPLTPVLALVLADWIVAV